METENDEQPMFTMVKRPPYTQSNFNLVYNYEAQTAQPVKQRIASTLKENCTPSLGNFRKILFSFFPFINIMKMYSIRRDLFSDIVSGLTVGVMHIPQGMAYGMLANIDPVYGLYTSFFPVIVYFFLGTSLHISIGTFAVVSLMIGSVVDKTDCYSRDDQNVSTDDSCNTGSSILKLNTSGGIGVNLETELLEQHTMDSVHQAALMCNVGYVVAVTMLVGIYQLCMGIIRAGFVTIYLSDPLTRALTTGAAVHVFTSQIRHVFGVKIGSFQGPLKLIFTYLEFFRQIPHTNVGSLIMAIICIIIIYSLQRWVSPLVKAKMKIPLPVELIMLIFATIISSFAKFSSKEVFEMKVVGNIPTGFPSPAIPPGSKFRSVAVDAIGIAVVSFAINISMGKIFAKKHGYKLKSNQELMAYGITNIVCSMFNCYVSTASLSRSVVQESVGGKTQVAGLVSCFLLLIVLLAVGPVFRELPNCVLAAIIIVNLKGVFLQAKDIPKLYKISVIDMMIWIVTFLAVVLTDVDLGLFIGVGFSLCTIVFRTQRVHTCILGRLPHTDVYDDIKIYPSAKEIKNIKIYKFCGSLCYANADLFVEKLYKMTKCNPVAIKAANMELLQKASRKVAVTTKVRKRFLKKSEPTTSSDSMPRKDVRMMEESPDLLKPDFNTVIIDCSFMVFVDSVGVDVLRQVINDYHAVGVHISFARCNENVFELLKHTICKKNKDEVKLKVVDVKNVDDKKQTSGDVTDNSGKDNDGLAKIDNKTVKNNKSNYGTVVLKETAVLYSSVHDAVIAAVGQEQSILNQFLDDHGSIIFGWNYNENTAGHADETHESVPGHMLSQVSSI